MFDSRIHYEYLALMQFFLEWTISLMKNNTAIEYLGWIK